MILKPIITKVKTVIVDSRISKFVRYKVLGNCFIKNVVNMVRVKCSFRNDNKTIIL